MSHEIPEEISSLSSAVQLTNVFRGIQIKLDFFVCRFFSFLSLFVFGFSQASRSSQDEIK